MKVRPRILVLDPAGNMWGSERVLLDFLNSEVVRERHIALCCPPDSPLATAAHKIGVSVYPFFIANLHEKGKLSRLRAAIGLYKACMQHQSDIIYVNQAGASRIALLVGRLIRIPVIPHVRLFEDVKYIEDLNASEYSMPHVLVISNFIADSFKNNKFNQRVTVLYDAYTMTKAQDFDLSLPQDSTEICCAGRLEKGKGQHVLIQSLAVLKALGINLSLNLYGKGLPGKGFEAELDKLVEDLNLNSWVSFHGFLNDIPSEMRRHKAVVVPSQIEGLGRVVFEAWDSKSLPIVGAFSGGPAEVVNASQGGGALC